MWNKNRIVDGANDNLSGCYMGIAVMKALQDAGITLENTEVGVILSGSEEAGLRGAKAWCEQHKGEFDDVPTFIFSYDTIHDPKFLMTNYRDLNGTVKADKDVSDLFMEAAAAIHVPCKKGSGAPAGRRYRLCGLCPGRVPCHRRYRFEPQAGGLLPHPPGHLRQYEQRGSGRLLCRQRKGAGDV